MTQSTDTTDFDAFVLVAEPRLRRALCAALGWQAGNDASVDALAHGWENWDRVATMANPIGYLFVVGRDRGRRLLRERRVALLDVDVASTPWIEPGLPDALSHLSETQRLVVMLVHSFEWTFSEVAELLDVTKSTVQTHHDRGMARLRSRMGVPQ